MDSQQIIYSLPISEKSKTLLLEKLPRGQTQFTFEQIRRIRNVGNKTITAAILAGLISDYPPERLKKEFPDFKPYTRHDLPDRAEILKQILAVERELTRLKSLLSDSRKRWS